MATKIEELTNQVNALTKKIGNLKGPDIQPLIDEIAELKAEISELKSKGAPNEPKPGNEPEPEPEPKPKRKTRKSEDFGKWD